MFDNKKRNYLKSKDNTNKIMNRVIIALIPIILFAWIRNGIYPALSNKYTLSIYDMFKPLLVIVTPVLITCLVEGLYYRYIKKVSNIKKAIKEHYSILPGLFLGLIVPINTPIYVLILGAIFTTIIGKLIFGGFSNNIFNPALLGRLFIIFCFGILITTNGGYSIIVDTISSPTSLSILASNNYLLPSNFPYSLTDLFLGLKPGCLGEVSIVLCLISFIYLTITKTIKYKITITYILTVFIITLLVGINLDQPFTYAIYHILSGGLFFGAIFMATDPITSPTGGINQIIYGICLGLLTCFIRLFTAYPEGVLTSILIMNLFVGIINNLTIYSNRIKLIIILILIGLASSLVYYSSIKLQPVTKEDSSIISKEVINNKTVYELSKKGFRGNIVLKVEISNNYISNIEVLEQSEDYYEIVKEANYLNQFKTSIENISDIDTVTGATVTSNTIKTLVIEAIEDYKGDK